MYNCRHIICLQRYVMYLLKIITSSTEEIEKNIDLRIMKRKQKIKIVDYTIGSGQGWKKGLNSRTIYTVDRHMSQVYVMTALNLIETWHHTTNSLTSKYSTTLCHDAHYTSQLCHPYSYSYSYSNCAVHSLYPTEIKLLHGQRWILGEMLKWILGQVLGWILGRI